MKKILISIVLATFCLSVPVFGGALEAVTPTTNTAAVASGTVSPITGQLRVRRRRVRRARRIVVRRHYRRVYRRRRVIRRH